MTADVLRGFAATPTDDVDHLTAREKQVRALVERGFPDKRIAADLAFAAWLSYRSRRSSTAPSPNATGSRRSTSSTT
jgi:FixJ family two-component response regulator